MKKNLLFVSTFIVALGFSQNPSIIPDNLPGAFTDYIFSTNDVHKVVEEYTPLTTGVPKFNYPLDANNEKEHLYLDIYYADNPNVCIESKPLIVFSPGGGLNPGVY